MRKRVIRITAAAAFVGAFGATGAAVATADTLVELDPSTNTGAHCLIVEEDGNEHYLYSSFRCDEARSDIDAQERRDERSEERSEERREERLQAG